MSRTRQLQQETSSAAEKRAEKLKQVCFFCLPASRDFPLTLPPAPAMTRAAASPPAHSGPLTRMGFASVNGAECSRHCRLRANDTLNRRTTHSATGRARQTALTRGRPTRAAGAEGSGGGAAARTAACEGGGR